MLISSLQVSSNGLGLTGAGVCRVQPEGPAQDDTTDGAASGPATGYTLARYTPGVAGLPRVPTCFHIRLALGASISSQGCSAQRGPPDGEQENKVRAPLLSQVQPELWSSAHNSHAADGPLGNRQSSGSYGSFKPPFLPNNPSSGAVLIPSCRQLLGMPRPILGWIYRCAAIFTQLPALIPRLPDPLTSHRGRLLIDNTLKARPAHQGVCGPVSHGKLAGEETLGRRAWGPLWAGGQVGGRAPKLQLLGENLCILDMEEGVPLGVCRGCGPAFQETPVCL